MKPRTFEEAVELYNRLIKKQMKVLGIWRDYEEYYQCGLIALWRAYEQFEEEKGSFPAYALYTVRGYLLVQLQRETRFTTRHSCWEPHLADELFAADTQECLDDYMYGLNEEQQYVIKARFMSGYTLQEIADKLGGTYNRVRYVYRTALAKMEKQVKESGDKKP